MIGHRHGSGSFISHSLHRDVTASPAHLPESVPLENVTNLAA